MESYISRDLQDDIGDLLTIAQPIWPTLLKRETPWEYYWRRADINILPGKVICVSTPSISNVWMKTLCGDWDGG